MNIAAWCVALLAENDNLKFSFLERPGMLQGSAALKMLLKSRSIFRHARICREQRNYCSEFTGAAPTHLGNMTINRVHVPAWDETVISFDDLDFVHLNPIQTIVHHQEAI